MIVYKIKWEKYIADLYIPEKKNRKVIILLPGLPKSLNIEKIVKLFLTTGCIVIYPNFSGTFDSGGIFSGEQSIKDVKNFIKWAQQIEVSELYFGRKIQLGLNNQIILVGMSFGAITALLGNNDSIDKLILLSPALLFQQEDINKIVKFDFQSQMNFLFLFLKKAYPYSYRIKSYNYFKRFLYGYNFNQSRNNIERMLTKLKIPTLIIHGKMDTSIPWNVSNSLKQSIENNKIIWEFPKVNHSTSSYNKETFNLITKFIKN